MHSDYERSNAAKTTLRRTAGLVVALGAQLLILQAFKPGVLPIRPVTMTPARLIILPSALRKPPPPIVPALHAPAFPVPMPNITIAEQTAPPRSPTHTIFPAATARPANHFGAATDGGLAIDIAGTSVGGVAVRATLASFEAGVRARVMSHKRQPALAWDRRNTCVVNYRVSVAPDGNLAGLAIDPCAIPEINAAAREAIRAAAPFAVPPNMGAPTVEVHGSLIFHP